MVELNEGFSRAAAELVTDQAACNKLTENPRNICREEARAKSLVTRAELELARTGTRKSQDYLTAVKLDTAFDVARARCDDQTGDAKTTCTRSAYAARLKGEAELKRQRTPPVVDAASAR